MIGLDMHPDSFTAAALSGKNAMDAHVEWVHDHLPQERLEKWLQKHVEPVDLIVIEASGNTFHRVAYSRLRMPCRCPGAATCLSGP